MVYYADIYCIFSSNSRYFRRSQERVTTTVGMLRSRRNLNRITYHLNSRTSIKLLKPRSSGARYLTRSEIIGISLSAFLSLLIVSVTVYVVQTFSSIVFNNITDFLETLQNLKMESPPQVDLHSSSQFIPLASDLTWNSFTTNYLNKNPVMFEVFQSNVTGIYSNIVNAMSSEYASNRVRISSVNSMALESISNICETKAPKHINVFQKWISKHENKNSKEELIVDLTLKDLLEDRDIDNQILHVNKEGGESFYISDCNALNRMTKLKETLLQNPPSLPLHQSDDNKRLPLFNSFDPSNTLWLTIALDSHKHPNLTSSTFHVHRNSVSLLLTGRKHWVIFSPDHLPPSGFNSFESLEQWLHNPITSQFASSTSSSSSSSQQVPFEVLQEAGQAIYVPEGWYHAARSLSASPAVSIRCQAAGEEVDNYYRYLVEGERRVRAQDYAGAIMSFKLGLRLFLI